jgi:hypothetical protein
MLLRTKNILFCLMYTCMFITINVYACKPETLFIIVFPVFMSVYYCVCACTAIHITYVFHITERNVPPWTYIYKGIFCMLLYEDDHKSASTVFMIWAVLYLWETMRFIVRHAEKRIGKIDNALYMYEGNIRIAHLRGHHIHEDTSNRFHQNLFDTNRLYVLPFTRETERDYCAIHNYKVEREEKRNPPLRSEWERDMWKSSSDHLVFVRHRWYFTVFPIVFILVGLVSLMGSRTLAFYTTTWLCFVEILCSFLFSNLFRDVFIDCLYYLVSSGLIILRAYTTCY